MFSESWPIERGSNAIFIDIDNSCVIIYIDKWFTDIGDWLIDIEKWITDIDKSFMVIDTWEYLSISTYDLSILTHPIIDIDKSFSFLFIDIDKSITDNVKSFIESENWFTNI